MGYGADGGALTSTSRRKLATDQMSAPIHPKIVQPSSTLMMMIGAI
jgi:hypothetical protein